MRRTEPSTKHRTQTQHYHKTRQHLLPLGHYCGQTGQRGGAGLCTRTVGYRGPQLNIAMQSHAQIMVVPSFGLIWRGGCAPGGGNGGLILVVPVPTGAARQLMAVACQLPPLTTQRQPRLTLYSREQQQNSCPRNHAVTSGGGRHRAQSVPRPGFNRGRLGFRVGIATVAIVAAIVGFCA